MLTDDGDEYCVCPDRSEIGHRLLSRLAVFQSFFDREGAAAVASDESLSEGQVIEGVT